MFMFSLSAFKHLLNPVFVLFTWQSLFQECAATSPPSLSSRRLFAALQKCQQLRVDLVLQGCPRRISLCAPVPRLWFSRDPLADICCAILERDVVRFAALEKTDPPFIHEGYISQLHADAPPLSPFPD